MSDHCSSLSIRLVGMGITSDAHEIDTIRHPLAKLMK